MEVSSAVSSQVYIQDYTPQTIIDGVKVETLKNNVADEGDFCEVLRLSPEGKLELFPEFQLRQINRTRLFADSIKAWHMHFKQNEIWYVPPAYHIVVGLWDVRKGSPTEGVKMKVILGGGSSKMLFIPKGVAHGSANFSGKPIELFYFVDQQFNLSEPDENRIPWDAAGAEFWTPERD